MFCWKLSSAKDATFISQTGATPQDRRNRKFPALKARFTSGTSFLDKHVELNCAFSADRRRNRIPGALPQARTDAAPLALNMR
jgi:hypothetical protein